MDARIDHVTDARDTRPAFQITYRRYSDTRADFIRVQADDVDHAMAALTEYIGNTQYVVISIRQEVPQVPAMAPEPEATRGKVEHKTALELQPGDEVFPPYEIKTDRVTSVTPLPDPRRGEQWFRVLTENGVYDVGCDYRWILPV